MPDLHVCPLSRLHETVAATGASHVVTLITRGTRVERPSPIRPERHLVLGFSDILEPLEGHILPAPEHVAALLAFVRAWDREKPLVVHCFAGISRSTAAAYIAACALLPEWDEGDLARDLRRASGTATPNARLVALADEALGRSGRMVAAIQAIGRGAEAMDAIPFMLKLGREPRSRDA
jgi:predicted protein tyrosine phosphatase